MSQPRDLEKRSVPVPDDLRRFLVRVNESITRAHWIDRLRRPSSVRSRAGAGACAADGLPDLAFGGAVQAAVGDGAGDDDGGAA